MTSIPRIDRPTLPFPAQASLSGPSSPHHRGVFGRKAGSVPGFPYSPALRQASVTWDETTLDRWLANPQQLVPGTKMFFELANATDRADVIAYLKELKQP